MIIANRFRFVVIKIVVRKSKRFVTTFFNYFINWRINRVDFRCVIQRFERNIIKFQIFINDRNTFDFNFFCLSLFSPITSKSKQKSIEKINWSIINIEKKSVNRLQQFQLFSIKTYITIDFSSILLTKTTICRLQFKKNSILSKINTMFFKLW